MANNVAPDSWEQQADNGDTTTADSKFIEGKFSTLNVNAAEFVPSFCINTIPDKTSTSLPTSVDDSCVDNSTGNTTGETPIGDTNTADVAVTTFVPPETHHAATVPALPPDPVSNRMDEPPAGGGAPPPSVTDPEASNSSPEHQPADSWEEAAVDGDPLLTPENEEADIEEDEEAVVKVTKKKPVKVTEDTKSKKEHVNVVFIGHVDAGKSTIGGQIMALTGMVDKRTLEKYEREAKERSRETWYLSWALDTNQEEREKGKTVEVGRAYFETERKHFTILDAPGHKSFVPNMIGGAAQADLAVLVISARKGEFETGFDRGGQTREHAMLAKTAGVKHLVVLVNKMDDPTVEWDEKRYNECRDKILPYLRKLGFNPAKDLTFMPVSGQLGIGLKDPIPESLCTWYTGLPFITFIDSLPSLNRKSNGPFIMPIVDKYKDMGTVVMGKVEAGEARKGQALLVMPNRSEIHKMEMRLSHLRKVQEKMIRDMEYCIARREVIIDGALAREKKNPKGIHNKRVMMQKRMDDRRMKIKQVIKDTKTMENTLGDIKTARAKLQAEIDEKRTLLKSYQDAIPDIDRQISEGELLKHHKLECLVRKQRKVRMLQKVRDGQYKMLFKSETALNDELEKQRATNIQLSEIMEETNRDFPHLKEDIRKIILTIQAS